MVKFIYFTYVVNWHSTIHVKVVHRNLWSIVILIDFTNMIGIFLFITRIQFVTPYNKSIKRSNHHQDHTFHNEEFQPKMWIYNNMSMSNVYWNQSVTNSLFGRLITFPMKVKYLCLLSWHTNIELEGIFDNWHIALCYIGSIIVLVWCIPYRD